MKWWHFLITAVAFALGFFAGVIFKPDPTTGGASTGAGGGGGGGGPDTDPPRFTGGCFHVVPNPPPGAHASTGDRYCVNESAGFWTLVPGEGLEDWHSVIGGSEIPLDVKGNDPGVFLAYFDFDVAGHPTTNHGTKHEQPDFGFLLQINVVSTKEATAVIRPRGRPGGPIHGGAAHADTD